jgi:4-amino-4-deoxy-L-arabinose transferase-like glycosyltransferase
MRAGSEVKHVSPRRTLWLCALIFALAFGMRLAFLVRLGRAEERPTGNAEMALAAESLARTGVLGNAYHGETGPTAHVPPAYALLLAAVYLLLGPGTRAALLAQSLLSILVVAATAAALPLVARRARLTPGAGTVAGLALAVLPCNLWNEVDGAWEQVYAAAALLGLLCLFLTIHDSDWGRASPIAWAGLAVGFVALLHPSLLPFAFLFVAAELATRPGLRARVAAGGLGLALGAAVVVSPWVWRNYDAFGAFVPLRSNFGLELHIGNNPDATGLTYPWEPDPPPAGWRHPIDDRGERELLVELGEVVYMRHRGRLARDWIAAHPGLFARLTAARFVWFWLPPPALWAKSGLGRWVNSITFVALAVLTFAGLLVLGIVRHPYRWVLATAVFGPSLVYLVTHVEARYRYPIFALTLLVSADLVLRVIRWLGDFPRSRPAAA